MKTWMTPNQTTVTDNERYVDTNGTQYPAAFPKAQIEELSEVTMTAPPECNSNQFCVSTIELTDGVWTQTWTIHDRTQSEITAAFTNLIASSLIQIDADTDAIYGAKLGHRAQEYILAEEEATAFAAAGYTGTVPHSVHCWAVPKDWTAQQSADDILATATAWRGAQAAIREQRLAAKEAVRNATDSAGVETAMATWAGFVAYIRGQLEI
jgi:hypothetical protein